MTMQKPTATELGEMAGMGVAGLGVGIGTVAEMAGKTSSEADMQKSTARELGEKVGMVAIGIGAALSQDVAEPTRKDKNS